ncbi:cystatin-like protein [Leptotrombidium deliense]|uniref:Cystatin-like protein n=1 Tax=Leptotrombidium deliense TaxID=299467 RepID=A0A443SAR3_9ACAR|nr:cystatin-like protein [Leptotrombidium deliense]
MKAVCLVLIIAMSAVGSMVGNFTDMKDEKKIKELQDFCMTRLNQQTNSIYLKNVAKVVSAKQQVVSGMMYELVLEVGMTACRKSGSELLTDCEIDNNKPRELCTFKVWEKSWENFRSIEKMECKPIE